MIKHRNFRSQHSQIIVNHINKQSIFNSFPYLDSSRKVNTQPFEYQPKTDRSTLEMALQARLKTEDNQLRRNKSTLLLKKKKLKAKKKLEPREVINQKYQKLPILMQVPTIRLQFEGQPSLQKFRNEKEEFSSRKSINNNEFRNYIVKLKQENRQLEAKCFRLEDQLSQVRRHIEHQYDKFQKEKDELRERVIRTEVELKKSNTSLEKSRKSENKYLVNVKESKSGIKEIQAMNEKLKMDKKVLQKKNALLQDDLMQEKEKVRLKIQELGRMKDAFDAQKEVKNDSIIMLGDLKAEYKREMEIALDQIRDLKAQVEKMKKS